jgi:hypothetical protein
LFTLVFTSLLAIIEIIKIRIQSRKGIEITNEYKDSPIAASKQILNAIRSLSADKLKLADLIQLEKDLQTTIKNLTFVMAMNVKDKDSFIFFWYIKGRLAFMNNQIRNDLRRYNKNKGLPSLWLLDLLDALLHIENVVKEKDKASTDNRNRLKRWESNST